MSCAEEPSQVLAGVAVGQPCLFSFKEDLDHGVLSGGGGVRSIGSSNCKGQGEGSSKCIQSVWGGWHRERLRMEREE